MEPKKPKVKKMAKSQLKNAAAPYYFMSYLSGIESKRGNEKEALRWSKKAWKSANLKSEREHVTPYIIKNSDFKGGRLFSATNYSCKTNYSNIRMTVDEISDFELVEILIRNLGTDKTWEDYSNYIINNNLTTINGEIIRNEGYLKSLIKDK